MKNNLIEIPSDKSLITESFLALFGDYIKIALSRLLGSDVPEIRFRGRATDIKSLYNVLSHEKRYAESFMNHQLNNPQLINDKYKLEQAIASFEHETGIKWPLK